MRPRFADREYIRRFTTLKKEEDGYTTEYLLAGRLKIPPFRLPRKKFDDAAPAMLRAPLTPRIGRGPTDCEHNGVEGARIRTPDVRSSNPSPTALAFTGRLQVPWAR
jgi:hypothetical protein